MDASGIRGQPQLSASGNERAEESSNWCGKTIYQMIVPDVNNSRSKNCHKLTSSLCWGGATGGGAALAGYTALSSFGIGSLCCLYNALQCNELVDAKIYLDGIEEDDCTNCSRFYCAFPAGACIYIEGGGTCGKHTMLCDKTCRTALQSLPCTKYCCPSSQVTPGSRHMV